MIRRIRESGRSRVRTSTQGYVPLAQGIYLGTVLLGISWYAYRLIGAWMFRIWGGGI